MFIKQPVAQYLRIFFVGGQNLDLNKKIIFKKFYCGFYKLVFLESLQPTPKNLHPTLKSLQPTLKSLQSTPKS